MRAARAGNMAAVKRNSLTPTPLKVVLVHAHPDDEAIWTGGAIAKWSDAGHEVTVITATLGEAGEVIGALPTSGTDAPLAQYRREELQAATRALGARSILLGGEGAFHDSGMVGEPAQPRPLIDNQEAAAAALVDTLAALAPDVVITYDAQGGYGHRDHIATHHITLEALEQLPEPPGLVLAPKIDRATFNQAQSEITGLPDGWGSDTSFLFPNDDPSREDGFITNSVDYRLPLTKDHLGAKLAAMRAHATQLWLADGAPHPLSGASAHATHAEDLPVAALSNLVGLAIAPEECFQMLAKNPSRPTTVEETLGLVAVTDRKDDHA